MSRRLLRTRWYGTHRLRWRFGVMRNEWWIGMRFDFASELWLFGFVGLVLAVGRR